MAERDAPPAGAAPERRAGARLAIDMMGGDQGIPTTLPASLACLERHDDITLIMVGDVDAARRQFGHMLDEHAEVQKRLEWKHAPEKVEMSDKPAFALRARKKSSMRIAVDMVREGDADAVVSAGNTGALLAISRYVLRTLPGVERPALIAALPTAGAPCHMLDLGANIDCRADHLFQFAVMGAVLTSIVHNVERPRIALLNIGQEQIKGNDEIRGADQRLRESDLNYVGYVEADRIFEGLADVIVADGFAGNTALKASEGVVKMISKLLKSGDDKLLQRLGGLLAAPFLHYIKQRLDPRRFNGASLLGLQGVVIKSHGGADQRAFENAIEVTRIEALKRTPERIDRALEEVLL